MSQISARVPDDLVADLDKAARRLHRSRAELVRQALEHYLDEYYDLASAVEVLQDPNDEVLDWEEVRSDLLNSDKA